MSEQKTNPVPEGKSAVGTVIGTVVLVAASVAGGWIACDLWPKRAAVRPPRTAPVVTVAVTNVESRVYNIPERFVAHAEPMQEVDLLPQVDGYIKELKFKEGDLVTAGDVLYVLDDERYQAVVNQRKADLRAAEAEANRAARYLDRMQKADVRGITQLELDNAISGAETAKATVEQAKANLIVAEYDLKKATVIAPISGQIGKSAVYVGDYVSPSKGALAHIVQVDPIRVSFPLTDRAYIAWRQAGVKNESSNLRMRLILPDGSDYQGQGTWDFDDNEMSKETATIMMRLSFPNPDRLLVPNSYVTLLTDFVTPPRKPCVPQQCVFDLPGGNQGIWVVRDDETIEQRVVTVGENFEGWVPVTGVCVGETVVLSGTAKLGVGMKIARVKPTENEDITTNFVPPIKE